MVEEDLGGGVKTVQNQEEEQNLKQEQLLFLKCMLVYTTLNSFNLITSSTFLEVIVDEGQVRITYILIEIESQ